MDFTGLVVGRYKKNRLLSNQERKDQLFQDKSAISGPNYELAVIKCNSTYLDSVDRYFDSRGALTFAGLIGICFCIGVIATIGSLFVEEYRSGKESALSTFGSFLGIIALFGPLGLWVSWAASKEIFRLTHYPIRLNRRNRMLYVFKLDGTILAVPWNKVFFTLGRCSSMHGKTWDIRGIVLNDDGQTVKEEFAFSLWSNDKDHLRCHWESLRRYMEEGPRDLVSQIEFCMPVDGKRESFRAGVERIFAVYSGSSFFYWLMFPFNIAIACCRWIVMQTCKVPVWPKEIEDACPIHPGDPFVRDSSINPPNLR